MEILCSSSDMRLGALIGIGIGVGSVLLGLKGFSPEGLPFTEEKRIKGNPAKIIGAICFVLGILFIICGIFAVFVSLREDF